MTKRYRYATTLAWGGDVQTGEADVVCEFTVDEGYPARGPSYSSGGEPGEPASVDEVWIISLNGSPWAEAEWSGLGLTEKDAHDELVEKLLDERMDAMLEAAAEEDADEEAAAADMRYDERQEDLDYWREQARRTDD